MQSTFTPLGAQPYLVQPLTSLQSGAQLSLHTVILRFYYPHLLTRGAGHSLKHLRISVPRKTMEVGGQPRRPGETVSE